MDLQRISKPLTAEQKLSVVSVDQVKAQARVLHREEDQLIQAYVLAGFDHLHGPDGWLNGYCLLKESFVAYFADQPDTGCSFEVPMRPVVDQDSVILSRRLTGNAGGVGGSMPTLGPYTAFGPDAVMVAQDNGMTTVAPLTRAGFQRQIGVVDPRQYRLAFDAGHATAADVPQPLKLAIMMLAAHWYQNREATVSDPRSSNVSKKVEYGLASLAGRYRISPDHS